MKKTVLYLSIGIIALSVSAFVLKNQLSKEEEHSTCKGSNPCNACKNCKYCGHCAKNGGTCGVCK